MNFIKFAISLFVAVLLFSSCRNDDRFNQDASEVLSALPQNVNYPSNNPYSLEKENLGRLLY